MIQHVGGGEASYKEVLLRLKESCANHQVMRAAHVACLKHLHPGKSQNDFVKFAESVRAHLFEISQIAHINDSSHPDLIGEICSNLSPSLIESWNEKAISETGTLNDFGSWLYKKAYSQQTYYNRGIDDANKVMTTRTFNTSSNFVSKEKESLRSIKLRICHYCSQEHHISKCKDFIKKELNEKKDHLSKIKACLNCLNQGHRTDDCRFEKHCKLSSCKGKHHYLLHKQ